MKIAVVDDNIQAYKQLCSFFEELLGAFAEMKYFSSGENFLQSWQDEAFDMIILDIFMDGITGLDVARQVRKVNREIKIVFSTSSNEFASESYEVNACYYLRKPFGKEQVKALIDRLNLAEIEQMRTVKLPDGTSVILRRIIYADCASHIVTLHCKQDRSIVFRSNFSEIESLLCGYPYFISPTKGIVINFYEVLKQNRDTFEMSDGTRIPISRRKAGDALEAYSSFLFEQIRKGDINNAASLQNI